MLDGKATAASTVASTAKNTAVVLSKIFLQSAESPCIFAMAAMIIRPLAKVRIAHISSS